jgi:hypothetical protein
MAKPINVSFWELHRINKLDGVVLSVHVNPELWSVRIYNEVIRSLTFGVTYSHHGRAAQFAEALAKTVGITLWQLTPERYKNITEYRVQASVPKGTHVDDPCMADINNAKRAQLARELLLGMRGGRGNPYEDYAIRLHKYSYLTLQTATKPDALKLVELLNTAFRPEHDKVKLLELASRVQARERFTLSTGDFNA